MPEEERLRAAARSSEKAAFFVRNELLHAPCTARRTDARRSAATGSAARTARRSGILSRRTEEKIDPGSGAACVPAEIAKHRAPGRPLSGGGRLSVGVGRKRPLGHPLRLVQRMDAAASIRRSPSEKMRRKELAGRQREGERGCRSGKAAFCLLLPTILVYRYTGILVKRGEAVFLNKSRGGFLSILNRRRENGRISGRQTGTEGAWAAAFCFMRSFLRGAAPHRFYQTFRSENRFVFQQTLSDLSLRGGHFQCPTRQSLTERDGIPERGTARLRSEIRSLIV